MNEDAVRLYRDRSDRRSKRGLMTSDLIARASNKKAIDHCVAWVHHGDKDNIQNKTRRLTSYHQQQTDCIGMNID